MSAQELFTFLLFIQDRGTSPLDTYQDLVISDSRQKTKTFRHSNTEAPWMNSIYFNCHLSPLHTHKHTHTHTLSIDDLFYAYY